MTWASALNARPHHHPGVDKRQPLLECVRLEKSFGQNRVVNSVSFEIYPGECLGVIGPNGAGKTTTLKMLLGLLTPEAGQIRAFGAQMPEEALFIKSRLGVVSQFDTLDPDFTCVENLLVFGRYFGLPKSELMQRIPLLLEFAALTNKAKDKPQALSGGMKRRLSLARALINDPELLILDEPSLGLSPLLVKEMFELIHALKKTGLSILLVEQNVAQSLEIADRAYVLENGEIRFEGQPKELLKSDAMRQAYLGV